MTMTRRALAAAAVGAALFLPTVTLPATATAAPSEGECTERYGYEPKAPEIDPKTGKPKFVQKRGKPTKEAYACMHEGDMKTRTPNYTRIAVVGGISVLLLGYGLRQKRNGTYTTLREDWQEVKDAFADAREEWEQERAEQERIEQEQWEPQQGPEHVYDYDDYSPEPTYSEPAPTEPAPAAPAPRNAGDGWDF